MAADRHCDRNKCASDICSQCKCWFIIIQTKYQLCSFAVSCEWTSHTSSLCTIHSAFGILCLCKIKTKINPTHHWLFWLWKCFSINCYCHFITLVINKNSKQCDKQVKGAILFLLWKKKKQIGNFWLLPSDLIQHHYVIQEGKILPSFPAFFWLRCYLYYIPLRYYLFLSISLFSSNSFEMV